MKATMMPVPEQDRWDCLVCGGFGVRYYKKCNHSGLCSCLEHEAPCEACGETGDLRCEFCGEASARVKVPGGRYCAMCAEVEG